MYNGADFITDKRTELNDKLISVLGSSNVYFEPPESVKLRYPCIVYERSAGDTNFADNMPYGFKTRYQVTLISKKADESAFARLSMSFPSILYNRHFVSDGLHHDVFSLWE